MPLRTQKTLYSNKYNAMPGRLWLIVFLLFTACSKPLLQPGRAVVLNGGDNTVQVVDLHTFRIIKTKHLKAEPGYFAHHLDVSANKKYLSIAFPEYDFSEGHEGLHGQNKPGKILVLTTRNLKVKLERDVPKANYNAVFSPSGTEIWTAGYSHSGRVYVYEFPSGNLKKEIIVESDPSDVVFSQNGKYATVACGESSFVTLIDPLTYRKVRDVKVDPYPYIVRGGSEKKLLIENRLRKSLNLLDYGTMRVTEFIDLGYVPLFSKYNAITDEIWVVPEDTPEIHVYKKAEKEKWVLKERIPTEFPLSEFEFHQNRLIGISNRHNVLLQYNIKTGKLERELATGHKPNGLRIWD